MTTAIVNCLACNVSITDPDFRVVLCQDEYPDIEIGPYCESCMGKIKICSGCQRPHLGSECKGSSTGDYYCPTCFANFTKCPRCEEICTEAELKETHDAFGKVCSSCIKKHYFECSCCNEVHILEDEVESTSFVGLERAGVFRKYKRICKTCFEKKKTAFKRYDVRTCQHCGKHFSWKEGMPELYCSPCYDRFNTCSCCGIKKPHIKQEKFHYVDSDGVVGKRTSWVCRDCVRQWEKCSLCGTYHKSSVSTFIKGSIKTHKVCPSCANSKECKNCGGLFFQKDGEQREHCNECTKQFLKNRCGSCGQIKDSAGRCRVCNSMGIYAYSYKHPLFYNYLEKGESRRDTMFFGFENEVTFDNSDSTRNKRLKDMYKTYDCSVLSVKSDGSISGYGYEVVSQPMSLLYFHKLDLNPILPKELKQSSSCGLHIHVGRGHFVSDVHLYKVINLLRDNKKFTEYAAGRPSCGYSAEIKVKPTKHIKDSKNGDTERRSMVNLTNKETVEFRLFAGCTTEFELRSRFEFLHALITFCKQSSISEARSVERFIKWMTENEVMYPRAAAHFSKFTI